MSSWSWQWDSHRNEYCYWVPNEGYWSYQSGSKVWPDGTTVVAEASSRIRNVPSAAETHRSNSTSTTDTITQQISNLSLTPQQAASAVPQASHYAAQQMQQSYQQQALVTSSAPISAGGYDYNVHYQPIHGPQPIYESRYTDSLQHGIQQEPKNEITDSELYRQGLRARLKVTGAFSGSRAALDPDYKERRDPKFFAVGKVIKILWPEYDDGLQGSDADSFVSDTKYDGASMVKIRWFVVVKKGRRECTCLPILTYGGMGVSGLKTVEWQHSIVYSSRTEPKPRHNEIADRDYRSMLSAIRVKPRRKGDAMDPMARVNYAKTYTIAHDVKVYEFGDVHAGYLAQLVAQWTWVSGIILNKPIPGKVLVKEEDSDDNQEEGGK